jgi:phosphoribosyl-ATP pyrophosphohydrolase
MDQLEATAISTQNLYDRFGLKPTQDATIAKMREELQEFVYALRYQYDHAVLEEAADVIVTVLGALSVRGLGADDLANALAYVRSKNDAKTHQTHVVHNGTIVNRAKLPDAIQLDFDDLEV